MRVLAQLRLTVSEDADQLQRDIDVIQTVDDTLPTSLDGGIVTLAASAPDTAVPFPKVTNGKYLVLIVWSGEVAFRFNNITAPKISIKPNPATTVDPLLPYQKQAQPGVVYFGPIGVSNPITSLFASNPSSTTPARFQIAIVGEAV